MAGVVSYWPNEGPRPLEGSTGRRMEKASFSFKKLPATRRDIIIYVITLSNNLEKNRYQYVSSGMCCTSSNPRLAVWVVSSRYRHIRVSSVQ